MKKIPMKYATQEALEELKRDVAKKAYYDDIPTPKPMAQPLSWQRLMLRNLLTALLGAVLALFALWCLNPRALQRTADNGWLTLPPCKVNHGQDYVWNKEKNRYECVDVPTKAEVSLKSGQQPDGSTQNVLEEDSAGGSGVIKTFAAKHELRFMVKEGTLKCWVRITADGQAPTEGFYSHPPTNGNTSVLMWVGSQVQAPSAEIRSGCPGRVEYYVDGNQRYPENHSGTPDRSEVVTLP